MQRKQKLKASSLKIKVILGFQIWFKAHGDLVTISGCDSSPYVDSLPLPVSESASASSSKSPTGSLQFRAAASKDSGC